MNELNFFQSWLHRTLQRMADSIEAWGQRCTEQKPKNKLTYEEEKQEQSRTIKILGQDVKVKRGKGIY